MLLTVTGVSLGSAAMASEIVPHAEFTIAESEPVAQTETSDRSDLEAGIEDFDWDLPNQNPPTQFGSPVFLPIQLTPPPNEEADGFAIKIDLTELDRLENVETER